MSSDPKDKKPTASKGPKTSREQIAEAIAAIEAGVKKGKPEEMIHAADKARKSIQGLLLEQVEVRLKTIAKKPNAEDLKKVQTYLKKVESHVKFVFGVPLNEAIDPEKMVDKLIENIQQMDSLDPKEIGIIEKLIELLEDREDEKTEKFVEELRRALEAIHERQEELETPPDAPEAAVEEPESTPAPASSATAPAAEATPAPGKAPEAIDENAEANRYVTKLYDRKKKLLFTFLEDEEDQALIKSAYAISEYPSNSVPKELESIATELKKIFTEKLAEIKYTEISKEMGDSGIVGKKQIEGIQKIKKLIEYFKKEILPQIIDENARTKLATALKVPLEDLPRLTPQSEPPSQPQPIAQTEPSLPGTPQQTLDTAVPEAPETQQKLAVWLKQMRIFSKQDELIPALKKAITEQGVTLEAMEQFLKKPIEPSVIQDAMEKQTKLVESIKQEKGITVKTLGEGAYEENLKSNEAYLKNLKEISEHLKNPKPVLQMKLLKAYLNLAETGQTSPSLDIEQLLKITHGA